MRAVGLGDPAFFRIKSGSNPHTRNRWGLRKKVRSAKAREQWKRLVGVLKDLGVHVLVIPAVKDWPGLVFAANAGVVLDRDVNKPFSEKIFLMSRLTPGRAGEVIYYQEFFERVGFQIQKAPERFEGEADFFPAGPYFILTHGQIIDQHFELRWGFPPYARVYGFRTDIKMLEVLAGFVPPEKILPCQLIDERFYHGDTVFCPFGPERKYLLVYFEALAPRSRELLRASFGDRLIPLKPEDAFRYAANSFYLETDEGKFLLVPAGLSPQLLGQVKEKGVTPLEVDVSEFFEKGGGSVRCMILDLGPVV